MQISTSHEFGAAIRAERLRRGFTQEQLAAAAGVGARFVVDLEAGKPSAELQKTLDVASAVGLVAAVTPTEVDDA